MGRRLVSDLETNGLYHDVTRVHLFLMMDIDTKEQFVFREGQWREALKMYAEADLLIWHNGVNYDLPVLEKLYPSFTTNAQIRDTLILTRLLFSDIKESDFDLFRKGQLPGKLIGSHGLAAWGYRLGVHKGDYGKGEDAENAWDEWTQEMEDYGVQDLKVTLALWEFVEAYRIRTSYSDSAIVLEHRFADLLSQVERNGFHFDVSKAEQLFSLLDKERSQLIERLTTQFRPWWKASKWMEKRRWKDAEITTPTKTLNYKDPLKADRTAGAPFCAVMVEEFNPGSRDQIADRLQKLFGWKPKEFTETGKPKVSEDVLRDLVGELDADEDGIEETEDELYDKLVKSIPEAKYLADYFLIQKRIGQLAEGKNGWLKLARNGKIHGSVNTLGAVTRRVTHSRPNVSQVPAVRSPYGKEMRSLWYTPPGWLQLGCDLSGIEIRCFANSLAEFDGGEYGRIVIEDDVHAVNQRAFGVPTRDAAKTTLYALLYGAGDAKLGSIVDGGAEAGKRIKQNFMREVPAYRKVVTGLQRQSERQGWIPSLDGGRLHVRSPHKALNTSLQSAGALVAKSWTLAINEILTDEYEWVHGWDGDFVMMGYFHDEIQFAIRAPGSEQAFFVDDYDYSSLDDRKAKALKAERLRNWYLTSFPQLADLAEATKTAIKRVEEYYNFKCPLDCEFIIGRNWADCH